MNTFFSITNENSKTHWRLIKIRLVNINRKLEIII
jgi:hypothetical protein